MRHGPRRIVSSAEYEESTCPSRICSLNSERFAALACAAHTVGARAPPAGGTHLRSCWRTSASCGAWRVMSMLCGACRTQARLALAMAKPRSRKAGGASAGAISDSTSHAGPPTATGSRVPRGRGAVARGRLRARWTSSEVSLRPRTTQLRQAPRPTEARPATPRWC
jgi:hypothetical protein